MDSQPRKTFLALVDSRADSSFLTRNLTPCLLFEKSNGLVMTSPKKFTMWDLWLNFPISIGANSSWSGLCSEREFLRDRLLL